MRLVAIAAAISLLVSCEAAVPLPAKNGWGASSAAASAPYPAVYPRVEERVRREREAMLERELPGWQVSIASSGFFAYAQTIDVPNAMKLASREIELAQRVIDRHPELFGLAQPERLRRWHDGLYFVSPVDDPRYGIALQHARGVLKLTGHLWPGFTMRSTARKDVSALLAPWLGRRFESVPRETPPCDRVTDHPGACPSREAPEIVTITPDAASYVVYAAPSGAGVEVRDVLLLPSTKGMTPLDAGPPVPRAVDARTDETLPIAAYGPGLCETEGACVIWSWFQDERHLEFDAAPPPRPDL